jgi:hypothetical protein
MIKSIKSRWKSRSSKLGIFLQRWVGIFLAVCTACGAALEFSHLLPEDWIPQELKYGIAALAFVGFIAGKLTVKKDEPPA